MKLLLADKSTTGIISFFAFIIVLIFPFLGFGQTVQTFTTTGSWTVPCGVTSVQVEIWGAGGGGGGSSTSGSGGRGGGGGAFVINTFVVVPGNVINYTIGAGGTAGAAAGGAGGNGGQTSTSGTVTMTANGGTGGAGNNGAGGGIGATVGTGGTVTSGVNGNAGGATGGTGGAGGNGGAGGAGGSNAAGGAGSVPGGGGGGGEDAGGGGGDRAGGAGGSGQIRFTYTSTVTQPNAGGDQSACGTLTMAANTPDAGWTGTWSVVAGTATITSANSPTSTITGIPSGTCATLRWTFSMGGCSSITDDVILCNPTICNDAPCNATAIAVTSASSCAPVVNQTTVGSTYSTGMPDPPCGYVNTGAGSGDVWYTAVVPADGQLQVTATGGGTFDPMVSIYDGGCATLQAAGCVSSNGLGSNAFPLTYAGTPGSTIYMRVNESVSGDAASGTFGICAYTTNTGSVSQVLPGVTTTVTCGSTLNFYDPGGLGGTTVTSTLQPPPAGNYTNNTGTTWTICPSDPTQYVTISFTQFTMETGFDKLIILSGDNDVIAQWTGNDGQGDVVSAQNPGECLHIVMQSDYSYTAEGWEAVVSCQPAPVASQINNESEVMNCTGGGGVWICADGTYNTAAGAGSGIDEINEVTGGCWGAAGEVATSWFYFTVATDGTLAFEFIPSNAGHNINFALFGPSTNGVPPCPLLTGDAPVRCSFMDIGGANTGLQAGQTDQYDGLYGNSFSSPLDVVAGETYALAVDVYQNGQPPTETQIDFTGVAALDCAVLLPMTLGDFSGINQGNSNLLSWIVYSQISNDYFTIERSMDGKNWEKVGDVDGAGTTQTTMYYSLRDENPYFPVSYYRLSQTDIDGTRNFSKIISVSNHKGAESNFISNIFPNPTGDFTTFTFEGMDTETPLNITVINQLGEVIQSNNHSNLHKGMGSIINTTEMTVGLYQVIFTQGNKRQTQKLAIIR